MNKIMENDTVLVIIDVQDKLVKTKKIGQNVLYCISDDHVKVILEYGIEHIKERVI